MTDTVFFGGIGWKDLKYSGNSTEYHEKEQEYKKKKA